MGNPDSGSPEPPHHARTPSIDHHARQIRSKPNAAWSKCMVAFSRASRLCAVCTMKRKPSCVDKCAAGNVEPKKNLLTTRPWSEDGSKRPDLLKK
jgi:hypothetical protein